ncbi:MAG: MaoC/PaaZ C-terminal domain-containing protein [Bacteroidota bacterium]
MQQGDKFTHRFVVDDRVYNGFIEIFNDRNPLHTDAGWAQSKGFKGMVMHGNILNGFVSYFVGELLPMKNVIIHAQTINFSLPVYMGDEVEFNAEVAGYYESVNTYEFKFTFRNGEGKRVAKGTVQIGLLA